MFKKFRVLGALSEFWEPHFFGILGALKFGRMGVHRFFIILPFISSVTYLEYLVPDGKNIIGLYT